MQTMQCCASGLCGTFVGLILVSLPSAAYAQPAADRQSADQILLKDYRPRVLYKVPRTTVTRARFPVIDMHAHPRYARTPEQVDRWLRTMDDLGINQTVLLAGTTKQGFDQVVAQFGMHRRRFLLWCGLDLTDIDQPSFGPAAVAELERCFHAGATGVGELIDKGGGLASSRGVRGVHIDDVRLDPLLEKCADLGLPINIHVGEPMWMYQPMDRHNDGLMNAFEWRLDNKKNILGHADVVATLERAVKRHPRTTFIACHFANCCYDLSILGRMLETYPNLYADCGARYAETAPIPRYTAKFFERNQDRLLYGTDMGQDAEMYLTTFRILETDDEHFYDWNLFTYHWPLHGFALSNTILKKIYRENALKILKGVKAR
jgi:predicted TIM-barrel fold metal-dependent hydrolase